MYVFLIKNVYLWCIANPTNRLAHFHLYAVGPPEKLQTSVIASLNCTVSMLKKGFVCMKESLGPSAQDPKVRSPVLRKYNDLILLLCTCHVFSCRQFQQQFLLLLTSCANGFVLICPHK